MKIPRWQPALDSYLEARALVNKIVEVLPPWHSMIGAGSYKIDKRILATAAPFFWTKESTQAVIAASRNIPMDTLLNKWNLSTPSVWWHFEDPLYIQTTSDPYEAVKAMAFGWLPTRSGVNALAATVWVVKEGTEYGNLLFQPSQTWEWGGNETYGEMLENCRKRYLETYPHDPLPAGENPKFPRGTIGLNKFLAASEFLSRFVLGGLAWINQRILSLDSDVLERHARKRLAKEDIQIQSVKVVQLRRLHQEQKERYGSKVVDWSCRWLVDPHWRNQACGPGLTDRKLIYIDSYLKGPDDKPFRGYKETVFDVSR